MNDFDDIIDEVIDIYTSEHQDMFDEIFKDDTEYQDAQRDIGEIEPISSSDPESVIYEMQYDYAKDNLLVIVEGGDK